MVSIRFLVTDFASHRTWIEGYQRHHGLIHDVRVTYIPGDRWKFRMMAAAAELVEKIALDDELLVVDAMIDVTVLVALLKSTRELHQCPSIYLYFHENQLTTPFTSQDRDFHKAQPTHWHYGMAQWRSLLVADGCIFNSQTHLNDFAAALPNCLKQQCPADSRDWQLNKCRELLSTKCTVLRYGLELDELLTLSNDAVERRETADDEAPRNVSIDLETKQRIPVILWNARLEEDKNPGAFLDLLQQTANKTTIPFRLIVLGTDASKEQTWYTKLRQAFGDRILFMGWCQDRQEYARNLAQASIVISTANHETFGISIVESVHCGALPLLPSRLSYPEIFESVPSVKERYLYKQSGKAGVTKLIKLLELVSSSHSEAHAEAQAAVQNATRQFRWRVMGPVYDQFFAHLANGESIIDAGNQAASLAKALSSIVDAETNESKKTRVHDDAESSSATAVARPTEIETADDVRVQLFRPKSLRNHKEYNRQWSALRSKGVEPALHGGRRAMVRMLEAMQQGAKIRPVSFLSTPELAETVLLDKTGIKQQSMNENNTESPPMYTADKDLLNTIRGQKLNVGDAILAMVQFPIASQLEDLLNYPPILILENVRNAENVGSILRTAFCLGIRSIVASATAWAALKDSRAARCSMGTMYYHQYYKAVAADDGCNQTRKGNTYDPSGLVSIIEEIQEGGNRVYGIEIGDNAKPISPHQGDSKRWAMVMGNEDVGLSSTVADACDDIVFIPQAHGDSLNVGHAAAIAMFELGREGPEMKHDGLAACT